METILHYRANKKLNFGLSYETVYKGDSYNQFSFDFRYNWNMGAGFFQNLIIKPQIIIGNGNNT